MQYFLVLLLFFSLDVCGIHLFVDGESHSNYNELVGNLAGQQVTFSNGKTFDFLENIPASTDLLYLASPVAEPNTKMVIRLEANLPAKPGFDLYNYYMGQKALQKESVIVVKVLEKFTDASFDDRSKVLTGEPRVEYVAIEHLSDIAFNYQGLVSASKTKVKLLEFLKKHKLDATAYRSMAASFFRFVESTANFSNIGDLKNEQIVYSSSRGWILVDFTSAHGGVSFVNSGSIIYEGIEDAFKTGAAVREVPQMERRSEKINLPRYILNEAGEVVKNKIWYKHLVDVIRQVRVEKGYPLGVCDALARGFKGFLSRFKR